MGSSRRGEHPRSCPYAPNRSARRLGDRSGVGSGCRAGIRALDRSTQPASSGRGVERRTLERPGGSRSCAHQRSECRPRAARARIDPNSALWRFATACRRPRASSCSRAGTGGRSRPDCLRNFQPSARFLRSARQPSLALLAWRLGCVHGALSRSRLERQLTLQVPSRKFARWSSFAV